MAAKNKPVQPKNIPEGLAKNDVANKPLNLPNLIDDTPIRGNKKTRPGPRPRGEFDLRDLIRKVTDFGILLTCLAILTWNVFSPLYKKLMEQGRQHDYPFEFPEMKGWHQGAILATLLGSLVLPLVWLKHCRQGGGCPCTLKHAGLAGVAAASSFWLGKDVTSKKVNRQEGKKAERKVLTISNALKYTFGGLIAAAMALSVVGEKVKKKAGARTGASTNISLPGDQEPEPTGSLLTTLATGAGKAVKFARQDRQGVEGSIRAQGAHSSRVTGSWKNLLILGLMAWHGVKAFKMPKGTKGTSGEKYGVSALPYVALWAATVPLIFYAIKRARQACRREAPARTGVFSRKSLKAAGIIALISTSALALYTLKTKSESPDGWGMSFLKKAAAATMTPATFYVEKRTQTDQAMGQVDIESGEGMLGTKNMKIPAITTRSGEGMFGMKNIKIPAIITRSGEGMFGMKNIKIPAITTRSGEGMFSMKNMKIPAITTRSGEGMFGKKNMNIPAITTQSGEGMFGMKNLKIPAIITWSGEGMFGMKNLKIPAIITRWTKPETGTAKKWFNDSASFWVWAAAILSVQMVRALKGLTQRSTIC